jgi:hypothetical protein
LVASSTKKKEAEEREERRGERIADHKTQLTG